LIVELLNGEDKVVTGVKMIVNNNVWERPVQLICPLEIKSTLTFLILLSSRVKVKATRKRSKSDLEKSKKRLKNCANTSCNSYFHVVQFVGYSSPE